MINGGFGYDEANHNGVAVEEVPAEVRMSKGFADPVSGGAYEGIGNYNARMSSGSEMMQRCFILIPARGVIVGTLSHTHLLLSLLCIAKGAKWDTTDSEGQMVFPCGADGRINTAAVTA